MSLDRLSSFFTTSINSLKSELNSHLNYLAHDEKVILASGTAVCLSLYLINRLTKTKSSKKSKKIEIDNISSSKNVPIPQPQYDSISFGPFPCQKNTKKEIPNNSSKSTSSKSSQKPIEEKKLNNKLIVTTKTKEKSNNSSFSGMNDDVSTPDFEAEKESKIIKKEINWKKKINFSTDVENETETLRKKQIEHLVKESHGSDKLFFKIYSNLTCSGDDSD